VRGHHGKLGAERKNMWKYIGGPIMVNTMLHMLQIELDTSSKTIYIDVMEARVCS